MKRALKINLNGQIFHIDEDAYEKLKNYLDTISSHFSNVEESKEIIDDIESRIAELLEEKLKDQSQVIGLKQVEEIIEIMGKPEEIVDDETTANEQKQSFNSSDGKYRRLYRDPDNAVFGGVAAGLSAYFAIDLLFVRILFVVLILAGWGLPFILYLVLWIAVPKALTAAEKLEMKGEKVNVSNLEKKVREEYEDVKENFSKARNSKAGRRTEDAFHEIFRILGVIIIGFFKIILAIIAVSFVIAGISLIASLIGLAFFGAGATGWGLFHVWDSDVSHFIVPFISPANLSFLGMSAIMIILIPLLAIIYGLFKALFRFKAKDKALGAGAFALWFLSLIILITLGVFEAKEYRESEDVVNEISLSDISGNTLFLAMNNFDEDLFDDKENFRIDEFNYIMGTDENIYGEVNIDFRKSKTDDFKMEIEKSSRGEDFEEALRFAENINYRFTRSDSMLYIDPYFHSQYENKWRFQTVEINIFVPEGKSIQFDKEVADYVDYIRNENNYSPWKMADKTWTMTDGKFRR
ncbi:MAG: PspC domain-containing protein [Bacteroidales bacterium]|nr:PspC domain-containing protein [Bacteroidales bacterium]